VKEEFAYERHVLEIVYDQQDSSLEIYGDRREGLAILR